jgi:S-adenosylmethionine/arginine decarboxylase-like enzyme
MPYHKHILIKAYANKAPQTDEQELNTWLEDLVRAIDMKVVIPPRSVYVEALGNAGLTGSVNIETSHAAIHIWCEESPNLVQLDVYSCKDFEVTDVLSKLREWDLVKYHYWLVDRNGDEFELMDKFSQGFE